MSSKSKFSQSIIQESLSQSLGIEVKGDKFLPLIKKDSKLPATKQDYFTSIYDGQEHAMVKIRQGESQVASENTKLDTVLISNLPNLPKGKIRICVKYTVNEDGILEVNVEDCINPLNSKTINYDMNV